MDSDESHPLSKTMRVLLTSKKISQFLIFPERYANLTSYPSCSPRSFVYHLCFQREPKDESVNGFSMSFDHESLCYRVLDKVALHEEYLNNSKSTPKLKV